MFRHSIRTLTILALTASLLTSCGNSDDSRHSRRKGPTDNVVRIASNSEAHTLDPRGARVLAASTTLNLMFEGLMRLDNDGELEPGVAESVEISPNRTTYTFHLRDSHWSNGDPVTAEDFMYAWKSMLEPNFPAPNAFQLYAIKNARQAKTGEASVDAVGVSAPDEKTLVVELDQPTPYFLELTAFHALFPVNQHIAKKHPSWAEGDFAHFTSNGPFQLDHWAHNDELTVVKNENYWDADAVKLSGVTLVIGDEHTALELFENNDLEWTGSPLSIIPPDAIASMTQQDTLEVAPAAGTHWLRVNVDAKPFDNVKMRKALSLALDRQALVEHVIQGNQTPAMGVLPPNSRWHSPNYFEDHDVASAKLLLRQALAEMGLTRDELPTMTLVYRNDERQHRLAQTLQQQWREVLGIMVELEAVENKLLYERLKNQDYQLANGSWFADFSDPYNFLAVFDAKDNGTNNTGWESKRYQQLLELSSLAADANKRKVLLLQAERLLMDESPVIPLFFYSMNFRRASQLRDVGLSDLGVLNFRNAELVSEEDGHKRPHSSE